MPSLFSHFIRPPIIIYRKFYSTPCVRAAHLCETSFHIAYRQAVIDITIWREFRPGNQQLGGTATNMAFTELPRQSFVECHWAKYRGKPQGRPVGANHCKFLSSHPQVPDDGRDRAVDGGSQEVEPLRPSGRNHDLDWLSPRLAGVRVVRSAMVAGRAGHRPATRPQGEERLAECPPDAGRGDTRAAASAARTGAVLARLYDRAGRADDAQGLPCAIRSDRGSSQDAIPDTSPHAAAWLRLCPSQRRPRHAGTASLAGAQEYSTHRALHRTCAGQVQGFLALGPARHAYQSSCSLTRRSDVRFRG